MRLFLLNMSDKLTEVSNISGLAPPQSVFLIEDLRSNLIELGFLGICWIYLKIYLVQLGMAHGTNTKHFFISELSLGRSIGC